MPTRGQVKAYKPRRTDGWAMCESVTGACSCLANGSGPCDAWLMPLKVCHAFGLDPRTAELDRVTYNVSNGEIGTLPDRKHIGAHILRRETENRQYANNRILTSK